MTFSIVTINYNDKVGIEKTIKSVINQTYKDVEYIVIDGGSTDGSVDVIKLYENHIDYWVSEKDKGVYNAMNKGIAQIHGDYVIFMNSGDCFHSNTVLEEVCKQIDDNDIIFGNCCDPVTKKKYGGIKAGSEVTLLTLMKEILCHQATVYRSSIFKNHQYDESLKLISDWKVNVQSIIFDNCKVKVIDTMIADYDLTGMSSTQSERHRQERQRVLSELFPGRILKDYHKLYTNEELPIVSLLPELKQTSRIQRWVYQFAKFLLSFKKK